MEVSTATTAGDAARIVVDPDIDFEELFRPVDTYLLGRRTFEVTGGPGSVAQAGSRTFVFSRTLSQEDHKNVTIVGDDPHRTADHRLKDPRR